jgi:uncharacterized protein
MAAALTAHPLMGLIFDCGPRSCGILERMALEMKPACERCSAPVAAAPPAFICSYECTFCPACAAAMDHVCPNCGGELVRRPRRPLED